MKKRFFALLATGLLVFLNLPPLRASRPQQWNVSTQDQFLKGEFKGVAVSSDGQISPAPALEMVLDTEQAYIHSALADKSGNLYLGTGNDGKIFRIPKRGQGSEWAKLDENGVFALAVDSLNRVYAGTSPGGKVYRLEEGGRSEIFFNPREKFIWALAIDGGNNLFVGTGPKGIIYKVTPQGQGSVFYDSSESHIVSLTWDPNGNLLAGSAPEGMLYRISKSGSPFVVYDSSMEEIKAVATDRYGNIFAAGLSFENVDKAAASKDGDKKKSPVTIRFKLPSVDKADEDEESVEIEGTRKGKKLELYRIDKDNLVDTLYTEDSSMAFDLLIRNDGQVLVATSDKGRIVSISPRKTLRLLAQSDDDQVTRLIEVEGTIYAATSNLGKVYRLSAKPPDKGVYESESLDAKMTSSWGKIRWRVVGAGPKIFSRSGNTAKPDSTWSDWSGPYTENSGSQILSPPARYLQWKAEFAGSGSAFSPGDALEAVEVSYLQKNMAPAVTKITVHSAGSAFVKLPTANQAAGVSLGGPDNAHLLSLPSSIRKLNSQSIVPPPREVFVPGARSVSWTAADPNDDDLVFALYYRADNEKDWKLAAKELKDSFFTLDGASLPDGVYRFRIVASDLPSNPPSDAAEGETVSKPFVISNSVPAVSVSAPQVQGKAATIRFTARAQFSHIYQAEYSLDGGHWTIVYPQDGIADSDSEDYSFELKNLSSGEHLLTVRVVDSVGNIGAGKASFATP